MATIKKVKKAQAGKKVTPTYKNLKMGVKNEQYLMTGVNKDVTPSAKDSSRYRGGFEQGLKGMKGMPNEGQVEKMGRWEGQNVNKPKKKGKMGIKVKKAQNGRTLKTNPVREQMNWAKENKLKMKQYDYAKEKERKAASKSGDTLKKPMKTGGTLAPSKKSVGKTFGKLNKAKYGSKTSKKK